MTKEDINKIIEICNKNYPKEDIPELSEFQDGARSAINLIKADILSNPLEHLVSLAASSGGANGGKFMEIKDYVPLDIKGIKSKWQTIYNIPSGKWKEIEADLIFINNGEHPNTARIFTFNNLPFSVMKIILENSRLSN